MRMYVGCVVTTWAAYGLNMRGIWVEHERYGLPMEGMNVWKECWLHESWEMVILWPWVSRGLYGSWETTIWTVWWCCGGHGVHVKEVRWLWRSWVSIGELWAAWELWWGVWWGVHGWAMGCKWVWGMTMGELWWGEENDLEKEMIWLLL